MPIVLDARSFDSSAADLAGSYVSGDETQVFLRGSNERRMHYAVKLTGVLGKSPTMVVNMSSRAWAPQAGAWHCAWGTSLHGDVWHEFDNKDVTTLTGYRYWNDEPFAVDTIYVAQMPLFTLTRWDTKVAGYKTSPYVFSPPVVAAPYVAHYLTALADKYGRTVPGFGVHSLRITDPSTTDPKVQVIIQGAIHADERHGCYVLEGALDWLLGTSPEADYLRRHADFYVHPAVNPQGMWAGYTRSTPENDALDINRDWNPTTGFTTEITTKARAAYLANQPQAQCFFDYHNTQADPRPSEIYRASDTVNNAYLAALRTRVPRSPQLGSQTLAKSTTGSTTQSLAWAMPQMQISLTIESTPAVSETLAMKRQFGAGSLLALYDLIVAGQIVGVAGGNPQPAGGTEPPASTIVYDLEYRPGTSGAWTPLAPSLDATSYSWVTSALADGTYQVRISARDTSDDAASAWVTRTLTVSHSPAPTNEPPTVVMVSPGTGTTITAGASVALAANASDVDGSVTAVSFYRASGTLIGAATFDDGDGVWRRTWTPPAGTHLIYARATDDDGATGDSAAVSLTVEPAVVPDAYFTLGGVEYLVIAEGASEAAPEVATGEFVRSFSGRLLSTAAGRIRRWTIPLYQLSPTEHATLRSAMREGRRLTAGGVLIGESVTVTVTLSESEYERDGVGHVRVPVLNLRAVEPV